MTIKAIIKIVPSVEMRRILKLKFIRSKMSGIINASPTIIPKLIITRNLVGRVLFLNKIT
jgi:hypothetical protein